MTVNFIHTADWQLGKPFAGVADAAKRALLQQERIQVLHRIAERAKERGARFVVVAGDLFDSSTATKPTVAAACSAIGAMGIPVLAIPGNHDHGGAGSIWDQPFFKQEQAALAPNFRILLQPEPVELDAAVLFPCPLLRRHEPGDGTAWLRTLDLNQEAYPAKPRIVLAHGSVQGFASQDDDEEAGPAAVNFLDLTRLAEDRFDYIALGDWHGAKQVSGKAWYAGTPELDRFPKGEGNLPGHVLSVTASRGASPVVEPLVTARVGWHPLSWDFSAQGSLAELEARIDTLIGARAHGDLLRLELAGLLTIKDAALLEQRLDSWRARLLRLKLYNHTVLAPSAEEIAALTSRSGDPLISRVATRLVEEAGGSDDQAAVARMALRELYAACAAGS